MANQTHVTPNETRGGWNVRQDDAKRASAHSDTQKAAMQYGRVPNEIQDSEFVTHSASGAIGGNDSYGNEPHPPPG